MKIALQFSGGKDSTALLFSCRHMWQNLTVYWLNTGDMFPEYRDWIEKCLEFVPHHKMVQSDVNQNIERYGPPSDLVPFDDSEFALHGLPAHDTLVRNRGRCCFENKMKPLHDAMKADGITTILRGQRAQDPYRSPVRSGDVHDGMQILFPIDTWKENDVWEFLESINKIPPLYDQNVLRSGDCMSCSAWLGDGRGEYLKHAHPEAHRTYLYRLRLVGDAIREPLKILTTEMKS